MNLIAKRRYRRTMTMLLVMSALLGGVSVAWACNVPVFRFALERWRPDPYRAVVFHRGPLTAADRELLEPLESDPGKSPGNLELRTVDVDELDDSEESAADKALWTALGEAALPQLVVQYPQHLSIHQPVFVGAPDREAVARLTDSPARQELIKRLAAGQTAVWLLLESGQKEQDDAAAALLESELKKLEQDLELPELTTAPEDSLLTSAPLTVGFSLLRLKRDDLAEQALVAMLVHSEADLAERTEPMVFPVYGRGRALWGLIGPGITTKNIHDSAAFLVGPCSCEVKELNPGFDLLLAADWDQLLTDGGIPLAAVETKTTALPTEPELVAIPSGASPTEEIVVSEHVVIGGVPTPVTATVAAPLWLMVLGGGGLVGLLVVVALVVAAAQAGGRRTDL
jgi:hypothetical protein